GCNRILLYQDTEISKRHSDKDTAHRERRWRRQLKLHIKNPSGACLSMQERPIVIQIVQSIHKQAA
ncbi:TPA: hypothetical protein ACKRT6_003834, partial [Providencia stuartii]